MQIPAPDAHQCVIGVAIALPSHYAAQVRAVREAAGDPLAEVVPPHITLLPPTVVDVDSLEEVMRHLRDVAAGTSPFEVRLDEVGTFRPVSPVVYLGLRSGAEECDRLQVRVRDRRGPLARPLSFPFHPHVTLAHEIAEAFDMIGGESNAATSKEHTSYYARVLAPDGMQALDVLAEGRQPDHHTYNVGTGLGTSVREIIDGLRRVIGWDFPLEVLGRRAGDPPKLIGDPLSIGVDLGWKANNGLDEILTSAWEGWQAGPRPITVPGA